MSVFLSHENQYILTPARAVMVVGNMLLEPIH